MVRIAGLEKHENLKALLEKVEKRIAEQEAGDAGLNMRKCAEYITQQYVREFPDMAGENLFATINNLKDGGYINAETASVLHKLRMFGNEGGAHYSEDTGGTREAEQYFEMLLAYIPEFLQTFPEPSTKELVRPGSSGLDYSQITDVEIQSEDFVEASQADYFTPQNYLRRDATVDQVDKLENKMIVQQYDYIRRIKYDRELTYIKNGRRYLNRKVLVRRYEEELKRADQYEPIAIPGIIQEYLGCHYFERGESRPLSELLNGTGYIDPTSKYHFVPDQMNVTEVLWEYASFSGPTFVLPGCITELIANSDYIPSWRARISHYNSALDGSDKYLKVRTPYHRIQTIIVHDELELEPGFDWRKIFPNLREVRDKNRTLIQAFPAPPKVQTYYFLESFSVIQKLQEREKAQLQERRRQEALQKNRELAAKMELERKEEEKRRKRKTVAWIVGICLLPVILPVVQLLIRTLPWLIGIGLVGLGVYTILKKNNFIK